jgi:hypothetical protein
VAVALSGCKAGDPGDGDGDGDGDVDAGPSGELAPPTVDPVPEATPLSTVAVRGTTVGTRVVAQGTGEGSVLASVLPGGSYCIDAALMSGAPTDMLLYAIGGDGRVSVPVEVSSTLDSGAAEPLMPTCSSSGGPDCDGAEICDNGEIDDDCDGHADACDTDCNGCIDDILEPNDTAIDVPMIEAGDYTLQICPCRDDWFAYQRSVGQRITATTTFNSAQININMRLYRASPGGAGTGDLVDSSFSSTGTEMVDFTVDVAGVYFLRIYSLSGDETGSYNLTTN